MNLDEHLEEIEEDFGISLVDSRAPASIPERRADTSSGALSWLNANGIVAPVIPKKSRWGSDDADQRAMNLINKVTETYYGKKDQNKPAEKQYFRNAPVKQSSQPQPQMAAPPMMPPPGFFPPPMFIPPPMPGLPPLPIPPGMPFPGIAAMMPPPGQVIIPPKKASPPVKKPSSGRFNSPYRRGRSCSRSPRRRSRSRSPPRRRRSPSSSPPLRRRSPDFSEGITTTGMTMDERRKFEENKIFVKLLLSKLLAIKSTQRLESLHVGLMSMVKKAIDDDVAEQHLRLQR